MTRSESYYARIKDSKNPEAVRRVVVEFFFAEGENASLTGLVFRTCRPTVIKLVKRYRAQGRQGVRDLPRRSHHSSDKTPVHHQQLITKLRT